MDLEDMGVSMNFIKKEAYDHYGFWMEKAAGQNIYRPLSKEELEYKVDNLPIGEYLGFLESMTKKVVDYKKELDQRKAEEEMKKKAEKEARRKAKAKKLNSLLRETKKSSRLSPTRATNMKTTGTQGFESVGLMDMTLPSLFKTEQRFTKVTHNFLLTIFRI
jgi:hypothetical protein